MWYTRPCVHDGGCGCDGKGIACGMEQEDLDIMQETDEEYRVKFRRVELWEQLGSGRTSDGSGL